MSTLGDTHVRPSAPVEPHRTSRWRLVLVTLWICVAVGVAVVGTDRGIFGRLLDAAAAGPSWLIWCNLVGVALTLGFIVNGPEPWRATRGAWAWAVLLTGPVGAAAFAVLSGPFLLVPAPGDRSRRLTGGRSFVLMLLLGSALTMVP